MSERQAGWYWVKCCANCRWEVAEYHDTQEWSVMAPYEIGPRIPTLDESRQCVPVELTPSMRRAGQHAKEHDCYIDGIYADIIAAAPKP